MDTMAERNYRADLREILVERFSESELRDLCFDLGIDYETLGGDNKRDKARELLLFGERHDRTLELFMAVNNARPGLAWSQPPPEIVKAPRRVWPLSKGPLGSNPYTNRRAIRSPEYFFGRSYEVRTTLTLLSNLQSISLVGPRRIGKSSLLYHISDPKVLRDYAIDPDQFAFILLSCEQLSDLSRDQILQVMLNQARAAMSKAGFRVDAGASPNAGMTFFEYSNALAGLTQFGRKLVYLLDEFEYLARNTNLAPAFFAGLRSIANNLDVAYVTASGQDLLDLTYADKSVLGSPFFNIFSMIRLALLDDNDARDLIGGPSRAAGVEFSDATVEFIRSLADHHPFFLQVACFHAFDLQSQKGTLTEADHRLVQGRVRDGLEDHLQFAWDHLKAEERQVLSSLDTAQDDLKYFATMKSLQNQCVICMNDNRYRLCTLWADFVKSQPPVPTAPEAPGGKQERPLTAKPDDRFL